MGSYYWKRNRRFFISSFFKSLGGRYIRIPKRLKNKPHPEIYKSKKEDLKELEKLAEENLIDLYYGDESSVSSEGYVPYGWIFPGEKVFVPSQRGYKVNCWAIISRNNNCIFETTTDNITAQFVFEQLDKFSLNITQKTVIVIDNASVHRAKLIKNQLNTWENRGLYLFYLPPYSPQLNIAEILWKHLKSFWIKPKDYLTNEAIYNSVITNLSNVGKLNKIKFNAFNVV